MNIKNIQILTNLNTVFGAFDHNQSNGLIAFASANLVCVLDQFTESSPKCLFTLKHHTDRVNSVQWISDSLLVSVSADKQIVIWCCEPGKERTEEGWAVRQVIKGAHEHPINYLASLRISDSELYFATMCLGGTTKLWQLKDGQFELGAQLLFGKNLQEAVQLARIGEKHVMLLMGGYDKQVHIYTCLRTEY